MKTKIVLRNTGILLGAAITATGEPSITTQPRDQAASLFADATFSVIASGASPLAYQWRLNNTNLAGLTNATVVVTNIQPASAGKYTVVVTDSAGSITSRVATLTITPFNSMHWFGFSWTATRCDNYPHPRFYNSHPSNGPMWPEIISTNLGLAYVPTNNHATCGATSADVLNQVRNFHPTSKPELSLNFLWAIDSETLRALPPDGLGYTYLALTNRAGWDRLIQSAVRNNSNAITQLYDRGGRAIVVETMQDVSKAPYSIGTFKTNATALATWSAYVAEANAAMHNTLKEISAAKPDLRLVLVDAFSKLNEVLMDPARFGFTESTVDALSSLSDPTFDGPGADYVFWDPFHGTSKLNELIASWHLEALTNSVLEDLNVALADDVPVIQMNHLQIGRAYTLQTSSELATWTDVQIFTASAGTNRWSVSPAAAPVSYFRLTWQR